MLKLSSTTYMGTETCLPSNIFVTFLLVVVSQFSVAGENLCKIVNLMKKKVCAAHSFRYFNL